MLSSQISRLSKICKSKANQAFSFPEECGYDEKLQFLLMIRRFIERYF
tara:strand:+ start:70582 stop:70725 length:144 start_codon:yes stop_codon:yes gene_type:complete